MNTNICVVFVWQRSDRTSRTVTRVTGMRPRHPECSTTGPDGLVIACEGATASFVDILKFTVSCRYKKTTVYLKYAQVLNRVLFSLKYFIKLSVRAGYEMRASSNTHQPK